MRRNLLLVGVILATALLVGFVAKSQSTAGTIELNEDNVVTLRGPIHDGMAGALIAKVQAKAEALGTSKPLYLVIDSPGGSVASGLDIIANLKSIPNLKTVTIFAASMGSGIVNGLPGERLGTENSISMFHRARGGIQGQFNDGELESQLNFWKGIVNKMEAQNASRMSISLEDYKRQVKDELWIHGSDNLTKKSLDTISSFKCTASLIKGTETIMVQTFFGDLAVTFSNCPLLTYPVEVGGREDAQDIFKKSYDQISKQFGFGNRAL
jgi:ATP-dependent Clp endopeptidase proteolytic subunit ClpP